MLPSKLLEYLSNGRPDILHSFDPVVHACWKRGEPVPYRALADTFELIESTSKRLKTIEFLRNFLRFDEAPSCW